MKPFFCTQRRVVFPAGETAQEFHVTRWGQPGEEVQTARGNVSFEAWLKTERERLRNKGVAAVIITSPSGRMCLGKTAA